jgi:REP element-mobilizing transposase RayT
VKAQTPQQISLFSLPTVKAEKVRLNHGGEIRKGRRKRKRTILPNKWIHLCFKSKKAVGHLSLLHGRHQRKISQLLAKKAKQNFVEVGDFVNMGNHLHIKLKPHSRRHFIRFMRALPGMIARCVTGASRGNSFGKFWDSLAYTRVINTRFELFQLAKYFDANRLELKAGYQARAKKLNEFNRWLYGLRKLSQAT